MTIPNLPRTVVLVSAVLACTFFALAGIALAVGQVHGGGGGPATGASAGRAGPTPGSSPLPGHALALSQG